MGFDQNHTPNTRTEKTMSKKSLVLKGAFFASVIGVGSLYLTKTDTSMVQTAHAKTTASKKSAVKRKKTYRSSNYKLISWDDLLPKENLKALQKGPSANALFAEGSAADRIDSPLSMKLKKPRDAYEQALVSVKVRREFNKKRVKMPGFIVPIDVEGEGITKKFFFVPFFGACLHLPPPPPNQIIYASFPKGYKVKDLYEPYYMEAKLYTKQVKNSMATAAYVAKVAKIYPYTEPKKKRRK